MRTAFTFLEEILNMFRMALLGSMKGIRGQEAWAFLAVKAT